MYTRIIYKLCHSKMMHSYDFRWFGCIFKPGHLKTTLKLHSLLEPTPGPGRDFLLKPSEVDFL